MSNNGNKLLELTTFEKEAVDQLKNGKALTGKDGVLSPLIKRIVEAALNAERDEHLFIENDSTNRRNGYTQKTIKTKSGQIDINTPRDRNGSFEPQIIPKRQTFLTDDMDEKIISMYGKGMSYNDICDHMQEIYGVEMSKSSISTITNKILPLVEEWQNRPLESIYPIVWLDGFHVKVKDEGKISHKCLYSVIGLTVDGEKDVLGIYLSENEGAKYWMQVLTEIKNRGVSDILIASVDGLQGFSEAINSLFPKTEVQLCIVHQIRNSLKYIVWKDYKAFLKDLKKVYQASTKELAEKNLNDLEKIWGKQYPIVIKSWRNKWDKLSQYFKYPPDIRKIMYTTNTVEGFHRQLRKVFKTKGAMPSPDALRKLTYLAIQNITKKWTSQVRNWRLALSQMAIIFEDRLPLNL